MSSYKIWVYLYDRKLGAHFSERTGEKSTKNYQERKLKKQSSRQVCLELGLSAQSQRLSFRLSFQISKQHATIEAASIKKLPVDVATHFQTLS